MRTNGLIGLANILKRPVTMGSMCIACDEMNQPFIKKLLGRLLNGAEGSFIQKSALTWILQPLWMKRRTTSISSCT